MQLSKTKRLVQRGLWDLAVAGTHEEWSSPEETDAHVTEERYRGALNRFTTIEKELEERGDL